MPNSMELTLPAVKIHQQQHYNATMDNPKPKNQLVSAPFPLLNKHSESSMMIHMHHTGLTVMIKPYHLSAEKLSEQPLLTLVRLTAD